MRWWQRSLLTNVVERIAPHTMVTEMVVPPSYLGESSQQSSCVGQPSPQPSFVGRPSPQSHDMDKNEHLFNKSRHDDIKMSLQFPDYLTKALGEYKRLMILLTKTLLEFKKRNKGFILIICGPNYPSSKCSTIEGATNTKLVYSTFTLKYKKLWWTIKHIK